jgi:amino acid transporter
MASRSRGRRKGIVRRRRARTRYRWVPRWGGRARVARGWHVVKHVLVGKPIPTRELRKEELPKRLALPLFASDLLSSVAYATEQMMIVLFALALSGRDLIMPLSLGVAALLALVIVSYRQTVRAYTTNGGAYSVAKDNLGELPALVAAAALLVDYVLTVAVSVSAGVTAIVSAQPSVSDARLPMALVAVAGLALLNIRGVRETGLALAVPTYAFIVALLATIAVGLVQCAGGCPRADVPDPVPVGPATASIGIFVVLRAFASGSAALTGIEAVSNGVSVFKRPKGVNAAQTLSVLGVLAICLFLGVSYLAVHLHAAPSQSVSVLSEIARAVFPTGSVFPGALFYIVQALTFAILILAANSAFQGFPRLAGLLARDRYLPPPFQDLGDRLVHSNGVVALASLAAVLILASGANVERLVHLYLLGVFCAFTLSQVGMVRYWRRTRGALLTADAGSGVNWRRSLLINATGACGAGLVTVVVLVTKFTYGAWIVVVAIPLIVVGLVRLNRHYGEITAKARRGAVQLVAGPVHNTVLLYVESVDAATHEALAYVRHLEADTVRAFHVSGHGRVEALQRDWDELGNPLELEVLETDSDRPADAVLAHVRSLERPDREHYVTVVIPELLHRASLAEAVRRRPALELKVRLLGEPRVVTTDVPVLDAPDAPPLAPKQIDPGDSAAFVIVHAVDDPTINAINYSRALHAFDTRALFFALYPETADEIAQEWERRKLPIPLEIVESPYRELGGPLLEQVRHVTRHRDGVAVVVLPEVVVGGRFGRFLHERRSLYLRWLLLFEPRTVLSSVPYQL